jgi:hypothetical protein
MTVGDDAVEKTDKAAERGGMATPSGPQLDRPKKKRRGPNPFVVVGAALALGVFLAKVLDWRSHAHPRD